LKDRLKDRRFKPEYSEVLKDWFATDPYAPDLVESPKDVGWHKYFPQIPGLLITGEGEYWLSLYTPYERGTPRPRSVDLDEWEKRGRKPKASVPTPEPPPKTSAGDFGGLSIAEPEN
jgi:hypothetical protein